MNFRNREINPGKSLLEALKQMDALDKKLLIIVDKNKFSGLISVGDIQRAIIRNISLNTPIKNILRRNIKVGSPDDSFESIKQMMLDFRMEFCPVIDEFLEIKDIYFWDDIFQEKKPQPASLFNIPIVIMAGGMGTRLKPLTNILPKPLIPIGEKTILEEIINSFEKYGCVNFHISVNYKSELIEYYIKNLELSVNTYFFKEEKPLGTAGSLSMLRDKIHSTFFVSNCDILIEQDYSEILDYHITNKNKITIITALKHFPIAYGTLETGADGELISIKEKPELTFKINTGMYLLEPEMLDLIPENEIFHITNLIEIAKYNGNKIGVFPVSQGSWRDIGEWDILLKNIWHL